MMHQEVIRAVVAGVVLLGLQPGIGAQGGCGWAPVGGGVATSQESWGHVVRALCVFDAGAGPVLYAAGQSLSAGGTSVDNVLAWDGSSWSPVGTGLGNGWFDRVSSLAVFNDGTASALYAGYSAHDMILGTSSVSVQKWDGQAWTPVGAPATGSPGFALVADLSVYDDGTGAALYASSSLATGSVTPDRVSRWDGVVWTPVGGLFTGTTSATSAQISAMTVFDDGTGPALFVGGLFTAIDGIQANGVARWDGISWSPLGSGIGPSGYNGQVRALAVYDDGLGPALYAAGIFTLAGGVTVDNIARWNGTSWSSVGGGLENGPLGTDVSTLAVYDDGTGPALHAGGIFTDAGGVPVDGTAKWDGIAWSSLGDGLSALAPYSSVAIHALASHTSPAGSFLFAGGKFGTTGCTERVDVAQWSCDNSLSLAVTQPGGPGTPVQVLNNYLIPGREYQNIFSLDVGAGPPGSGLYHGLSITTANNLMFLQDQLSQSLGTLLFHFTATSNLALWSGISVMPVTLDALIFDLTGGSLGSISQVTRVTIQ